MYTKKEVLSLLKSENLYPKKSLGQNFLVDKNLLEAIVDSAQIESGDFVLEIGTGLGSLTKGLADRGARILTIEKDHGLHSLAQKLLKDYPEITFYEGDALNRKNQLAPEWMSLLPQEPLKVVANLPYNIASPLMVLLFQSSLNIQYGVFLIQREMAIKMMASPEDSDFGRLSVMIQLLSEITLLRNVGTRVFFPPPRVDSALVKLAPKHCKIPPRERAFLEELLRLVFSQRRKKLARTLEKKLGVVPQFLKETFESLNIDLDARPERLSPIQYRNLAQKISIQISP